MTLYGSEDLNPNDFVYHRQATLSSFLWTTWLRIPNRWRLAAYRFFIRLGKAYESSPRVHKVPFGLHIKYRTSVAVAEAFATQYVSLHTTIPTPTVLDVLVDSKGATCIVMTSMPGRPLYQTPIQSASEFSDAQLGTFADTVRGWLDQIRQLPPPTSGPAVCGFMGTPFMSYRIDHDDPIGPFATLEEFYAEPFCVLPPDADPHAHVLAERMRKKSYRICFTHGDLSPNNILVDDNYVPVSLVDWGCAAWMPEYWDLTTSLNTRQRYEGWVRIFMRALPGYEDEFAVDLALWKTWMPY